MYPSIFGRKAEKVSRDYASLHPSAAVGILRGPSQTPVQTIQEGVSTITGNPAVGAAPSLFGSLANRLFPTNTFFTQTPQSQQSVENRSSQGISLVVRNPMGGSKPDIFVGPRISQHVGSSDVGKLNAFSSGDDSLVLLDVVYPGGNKGAPIVVGALRFNRPNASTTTSTSEIESVNSEISTTEGNEPLDPFGNNSSITPAKTSFGAINDSLLQGTVDVNRKNIIQKLLDVSPAYNIAWGSSFSGTNNLTGTGRYSTAPFSFSTFLGGGR